MTITEQQIKAELEAFIDWPTDERSTVTTASCLIFAKVIAGMVEAELGKDRERLDFMLIHHRKVVIERLPRNQMEIYVEEGFMSDVKYPAVRMTGEWVNDSPGALEFRKKAIDLAMADAARSSTNS